MMTVEAKAAAIVGGCTLAFASGMIISDTGWTGALIIVLGTMGVLMALLILRKPEVGLLMAIFTIPMQKTLIYKTINLPVVGLKLTITEIILFITSLAWLAKASSERREFPPKTPIDIPFIAFLAVAIISIGVANIHYGLEGLLRGIIEVLTFTYLLIFVLLITDYVTSEKELTDLLKVWFLSLCFLSFISLIGLASLFMFGRGWFPLFHSAGTRLEATFRNPNALASYLIPSILILSALLFSRSNAKVSGRDRKVMALIIPVTLLMLYYSASRGGLLGLLVGMMFLVLDNLDNKKFWPITIALVVIFVNLSGLLPETAATNASFDRLVNTLQREDSWEALQDDRKMKHRLQNLEYSLKEAFASSPLIGVGFGTLKFYMEEDEDIGEEKYSHITPATLLAETGLLGFIFVAVLWAIVVKCGIQNYLAMRADGFWRALNWGLLSSLAGLGFYALSHDTLRHRHLWLVAALIIAIYLKREILCGKETL